MSGGGEDTRCGSGFARLPHVRSRLSSRSRGCVCLDHVSAFGDAGRSLNGVMDGGLMYVGMFE
jgi:hypothetical protein